MGEKQDQTMGKQVANIKQTNLFLMIVDHALFQDHVSGPEVELYVQ